jgi:signal transduction histidine kinase
MALSSGLISIILVLFGAGVMLFSVFEIRHLLTLIQGQKTSKNWRILYYLIIFFLFGYGGVVLLISFKITSFIFLLMGLIFFGGACFVALVIKTGSLTIKELQTLTKQQLQMKQEKETAEAIAVLHSEFLNIMSHELRTPLNAIFGFSEILEMTLETPKEQEYIQQIKESGNHLLGMIDQVLIFGKLRSEQLTLTHQAFNLRDCVNEAIASYHTALAAKPNLELKLWLSPSCPPEIFGDRQYLVQTIDYLLDNAIEFTKSGTILLAITVIIDKLYIMLHDTGIGIQAEQINRLFLPFSMGDNSMTRRYGGMGLGLILCKHLLEMMGGEIWIESNGIQSGASVPLPDEYPDWQALFDCPIQLAATTGTKVFFYMPLMFSSVH